MSARSGPGYSRTMINVRRGLVVGTLALGCTAGLASPAPAKTVTDTWQISLQMPPQLWDDAASLGNIPGDGIDAFTVGTTKYRIRWANATVRQLPKYMLRQQGGKYGTTTAGLYDRPLTKKQLTKFTLKQRLLWLDADVLLADAGSPVCQGLTTAQLTGVLDGSVTDWQQVFGGQAQAVSLRVPVDYLGKPHTLRAQGVPRSADHDRRRDALGDRWRRRSAEAVVCRQVRRSRWSVRRADRWCGAH